MRRNQSLSYLLSIVTLLINVPANALIDPVHSQASQVTQQLYPQINLNLENKFLNIVNLFSDSTNSKISACPALSYLHTSIGKISIVEFNSLIFTALKKQQHTCLTITPVRLLSCAKPLATASTDEHHQPSVFY